MPLTRATVDERNQYPSSTLANCCPFIAALPQFVDFLPLEIIVSAAAAAAAVVNDQ